MSMLCYASRIRCRQNLPTTNGCAVGTWIRALSSLNSYEFLMSFKISSLFKWMSSFLTPDFNNFFSFPRKMSSMNFLLSLILFARRNSCCPLKWDDWKFLNSNCWSSVGWLRSPVLDWRDTTFFWSNSWSSKWLNITGRPRRFQFNSEEHWTNCPFHTLMTEISRIY